MKKFCVMIWRATGRLVGLCLYTVFYLIGMSTILVKAALPAIQWYYDRDFYSIELSGSILIGTILALWIMSMVLILTYWPVRGRRKALALS